MNPQELLLVPPQFGELKRHTFFASHTEYVSRGFIIKIAGACNLNCPYCYMYNLGDTTYRERPNLMKAEVFFQAVDRIYEYASENELDQIFIFLHGGEPLLQPKQRVRQFLQYIFSRKKTKTSLHLQTNGVLIDRQWIQLFNEFEVGVGISFDGPKRINDRTRVTHKGLGTHDKIVHNISLMQSHSNKKPCALCVIDPKFNPVEIFDHFVSLGIEKFDFLLPDYNHSKPPPFEIGRLQKYLIELFDHWYKLNRPEIDIRFFSSIISGLLGHKSGVDAIGVHPISEVVIETDGNIQPLDILRTCENGMTVTDYFVTRNQIEDARSAGIFIAQLENQNLLPEKCFSCTAYHVCGGGYMPHRYSRKNGFNNESVFCDALFGTIQHIYRRLNETIEASKQPTKSCSAL
jgi:uncharacterized protein